MNQFLQVFRRQKAGESGDGDDFRDDFRCSRYDEIEKGPDTASENESVVS